MSKHVLVVASGDTERRALPHLVSHLRDRGVTIEVRTPPRARALRVDVVEKIIRAAWYESHLVPSKFVVLLDVDQGRPEDVLAPIRRQLPQRVENLGTTVLFAYAEQHLEAWYFADASNLREYLGRALGSVDTSAPDAIRDPKRHLINLLGSRRVYTALTSEEIARRLDPRTIEQRSPSFKSLVEAVKNGGRTSV
ncbi:MAG: DUF4276 family protein [Chloroflexi bacterium]|nr:DUF4276 family protein [Chloroflexota bacterium]